MARNRKQSLDFRKAEVSFVMQRWETSASCSLVGIGSVGKSNLLQHLVSPEVQEHFLHEVNPQQFKAIIIDPNMLGPMPKDDGNQEAMRCWLGYELMMHRLFLAFHPFDNLLSPEEAQGFYDAYQNLQDGTNPLFAYMGLRYLELGLEYFMRRDIQIVFMFDEFEEMLTNLPVKFFLTLRGLRDSHKQQLSYLTFTRSPLPQLAERYGIPMLEIEPFIELFTDSVCYVGPYTEADARKMVADLMRKSRKTYSEAAIALLLYASGCYAGLLRACFHALELFDPQSLTIDAHERVTAQLAGLIPVRQECRTIWKSLSPSEQVVLRAVARLTSYSINADTELAVNLLVQKRLLHLAKEPRSLSIHPPIFRAFVATNPDVN